MSAVYVSRPLPAPGPDALRVAGLDVEQNTEDRPPTRAELIAGLRGKQALLCLLTEKVDAELLDAAPDLRIVANLAVGYDNVDVAAAAARGVVVTNTPDVLTEATAELTWALILAAARRVVEGDTLVRRGEWKGWSPTQLLGTTLVGKTLGIFGMGKIGAAVARRAGGFGMHVVYTNRTRNVALEGELGARPVTFDELLAQSDVLSLHAPATAETRHAFDAAALSRLRPGVVFVNTARGPLVDEAALVGALREGRIAAAGLDVFEREPALAPGLTELGNVVVLPHIGSATHEARGAMVELCCRNILAVLAGEPPITPVRPPA
ncbi:MAG TPA: D-glycerate dehydrogenase [Acidimicrobiia bacterium]|jgi:glyoxylate reductase|nr:D-glycerate dehydrogenase [Acidimicrobiia bacterium]